jgi:nicotinamidase-related amidase
VGNSDPPCFIAQEGTDWVEFIEGFEPAGDSDELVIDTIRGDATFGTELLPLLNAQKIQNVVLCGTSTSGSVLSTLRTLADNNFQVYVGADCIIDGSDVDWLTCESHCSAKSNEY